jgi:hypothetical protein
MHLRTNQRFAVVLEKGETEIRQQALESFLIGHQAANELQ